jgi:predicted metal-dependent phosphoesterase TrpH
VFVDLHVHTIYSGDSSITPKRLVDTLHAHSFLKTVAVTDHKTMEGYYHVSKLATAYEDILIMPGIEALTTHGDVVIIGTEERPPSTMTPEKAIEFAEERNAITIIPHPFRTLTSLGDYTRRLRPTAIEVYNPNTTPEQNKLALELAKELNLPQVAVSDAHDVEELGKGYTKVNATQSTDEILNAIKNGQTQPIQSLKHNLQKQLFLIRPNLNHSEE